MILLVRHGESDWNAQGIRHGQDDRPLTAKGIGQAWNAGLNLANMRDALILTSPLQRARMTADIIALSLGHTVKPTVVTALIERRHGPAGWMETCQHAGDRAAEALDGWPGHVIAVTHAGVIKGLLDCGTPGNGSIHEWEPTRGRRLHSPTR